jgi:anti-sigma B factor antagonist
MPDAPLTIATSAPSDKAAVLKLDGPLVISHLFQFQTALREQTAPTVVIDITGVPYMDSSGLGAILNGFVSAQKSGRRVVLAGINDRVKALFQLTKVDSIVKSYATAEEAVAAA